MENTPPVLEAQGQLQRFLAQATMEAVHAAVTQPWKEVLLEISDAADGTTCRTTLHVVPESGPVVPVSLTRLLSLTAEEIWRFRYAGIATNWKSMKLTITSERECKVNFAYPD